MLPAAHRLMRHRHRAGSHAAHSEVDSVKGTVSTSKTTKPKIRMNFKNLPPRAYLSSLYQVLVDLPILYSGAAMLLALAGTAGFFGLAYFFVFGDSLVCESDGQVAGISDALMYSISVTTTLGESPCKPTSNNALLLANIHAIVVQLCLVFITGVVFTRLSKPGLEMTLAKHVLFGYKDSNFGNVLSTRLFFNDMDQELIDVSFSITYFRHLTPQFFKSTMLELVRPEASVLRVGTTVMHVINEESALFGETLKSLRDRRASFLVTVSGTELSTMQNVFFRRRYTVSDGDVVDGGVLKFKDMSVQHEDGRRFFDFANNHKLVPVNTTGGVETEGETSDQSRSMPPPKGGKVD